MDGFLGVGAHRRGLLAQRAGLVQPAVEVLAVPPVEQLAGCGDQARLGGRLPVAGAGNGRRCGSYGRMHPPRADYTTREDDGTLVAVTNGNVIYTKPDRELIITSRRNGETVYQRPSA